jgi:hypothetical protein
MSAGYLLTRDVTCTNELLCWAPTRPTHSVHIGFVAFRPDPRLLAAAVNFAQEADYDTATGWDRAGWAPSKSKFAGSDCGQGRPFIASLNLITIMVTS